MFATIKEGIMELLDGRLGAFHPKIATSQFWAHALIFRSSRLVGIQSSSERRILLQEDDVLQTWRVLNGQDFGLMGRS